MNKIKEQRQKKALTQRQLSENSKVPLRTIEEWERGARVPRDVYKIAKVAKALDCRIEDLIELEE